MLTIENSATQAFAQVANYCQLARFTRISLVRMLLATYPFKPVAKTHNCHPLLSKSLLLFVIVGIIDALHEDFTVVDAVGASNLKS